MNLFNLQLARVDVVGGGIMAGLLVVTTGTHSDSVRRCWEPLQDRKGSIFYVNNNELSMFIQASSVFTSMTTEQI